MIELTDLFVDVTEEPSVGIIIGIISYLYAMNKGSRKCFLNESCYSSHRFRVTA